MKCHKGLDCHCRPLHVVALAICNYNKAIIRNTDRQDNVGIKIKLFPDEKKIGNFIAK